MHCMPPARCLLMCIGAPMRVIESGEATALCCDRRGDLHRINMLMVGNCPPGRWVMTFLGAAREILDEEDAARTNQMLDSLEAVLRGDSASEGPLPDFAGRN